MIYFEIPNFMIKRIYIVEEDSKLVYKKLVDNNLVSLTEDELNEVNKYLKRNRSSKYYSEKLNTIIASNPDINCYGDYLKSFLEYIESFIPPQAVDTFYQNLQTLKLELNLDVINEPITDYSIAERRDAAYYDIENNVLTIDKDNIKQYQKIAQKAKNPQEFFWQNFNHDLMHELFHVASSKQFDNHFICGFDYRPATHSYEENRGLTEGFTEILACYAVPIENEFACAYYIEELIINQLMVVIGPEVMLDSYFNNSGIKNMAEKLCEFDPDFEAALNLFELIEVNFNLDKDSPSNVLAQIEITILYYFEEKIEKDILNGVSKDDILKSIEDYKRFLVTRDILNIRQENTRKYDGIEGVLKNFYQFESDVRERLESRKV